MVQQRLTRQEKQERTRASILKAAETLIARQGVEGTSLEEIARYAGLTQGAIYSNFKSKADLWFAIAKRRSRTLDFTSFFRGDRPFGEELREFGRAAGKVAGNISRTDLLLDQEFRLYVQRHARMRKQFAAKIRTHLDEFGNLLEDHASARGEQLPLPGPLMARVLMAFGRGLVFESVFTPEIATEEAFADAFALLAPAAEAVG